MQASRRKRKPTLDQSSGAPLSLLVSNRLREAIVSGEMSTGAEMPSEHELTAELGVSRSTVREALRILQAQGLLSSNGTISTRRPRVSSGEALSLAAAQAMENAVRLAHVPLQDLIELRVLLEGEAVAKAVRALPPLLEVARDAVATMSDPGIDLETFRSADLRFHRALAEASGSAALPLVMGVMREAIGAHLGEALRAHAAPREAMAQLACEHAAILAAVEQGRPVRARRLISEHIWGFYRGRA